jgi:hypothetical protein
MMINAPILIQLVSNMACQHVLRHSIHVHIHRARDFGWPGSNLYIIIRTGRISHDTLCGVDDLILQF